MNIRFLETFVWIARLHSFTLTAERMHATQAAISSRIATLERDLGVKLFERDTREVRLTRQGQALLEQAELIVKLYSNIKQNISSHSGTKEKLRLGITEFISMTLLTNLIKGLVDDYPWLSIETRVGPPSEHLHALLDNQIDLALLPEQLAGENLVKIGLCGMSVIWVASPRLEFPAGPLDLEDLAAYPVLSYSSVAALHHLITEQFRAAGLDAVRYHMITSHSVTIRLAVDGLGVAPIAAALVQRELAEGKLRVLPVRQALQPANITACYLDVPENPLPELVVRAAQKAAEAYCRAFDPSVAWTFGLQNEPERIA